MISRRRVFLLGAVLVTVVSGVAVTVPALADTRRPPGGASDLAGDGAPELVSALRRDLALSSGQAEARLRKEAWARGAEPRLRQALGSQFGGAWLNADAGQLMVAVTSEQAAAQVRAAGATPKLVSRGEVALNGLKQRLAQRAERTDRAVAGWYVDVAGNQVAIVVRPGARAAADLLVASSGLPREAVRVVVADERPVPLFDVRGADPYFIDNRARCSIGFSVRGGFVTAGHCGRAGSTTTGFNQVAQGEFRASSFPGNDFGFVTVNANWTPQAVVNDFNGGTVPVAGSTEAPVGASICRSGSTTGTRCGVIQAKNATVNYPEGTVTGLTRTNVCAEAGDSGGPWLSGDQAQGVTSGGSGDCTRGGTTFFQPVNEILAANNLTLVVAGSSSPGPACAGTPLSGTLSGPGSQQVRPSSGFFQARAGRHVGCLSAPAGARFDLLLDRWNGQRWRTVARASGGQLTFDGRAGFYRYRVVSVRGSGSYVLGVTVP